MADNVFRVEVGANIGRSTNIIRQDINGIFKLINKTPQKITVSLNQSSSKHQLTSDIEKLAKNLKPKVTVQLNGGSSLKSGSGQKIMQDINKITTAISRQQAAKITLHLDVAASQKAMMSELKKLNLGVQITPKNGGGNSNQKKPSAPQVTYRDIVNQGVSAQLDIAKKERALLGLVSGSDQAQTLTQQINSAKAAYTSLLQTFTKGDGQKLGFTNPDVIDKDIQEVMRVKRAYENVEQTRSRIADSEKKRHDKGASWAAAEKRNYDLLSSAVSGSSTEARQFSSQLNNLYRDLQNGRISISEYRRDFSTLKKQMGEAGFAVETAGEKFSKMLGNRIGYTVIAAGLLAIRRGLNQIYENVVNLDTAMTELKKVTNETDETYRKFLESSSKRAKDLGATLIDTINATASFARLGYTLNQSADLADAALVYKNVGDGIANIDEASESVIATMQAFQIEASDAMKIVDKFNEVGNNFAISSKGVGDALLRSAAAMNAANNSLDETVALAAAANTIVQDPEKVGTVLKTLSMFLRAAKTEAEEAGESTDGMANSVSELRDEILKLTGQRVDIQLDQNTFKSSYQILKEISQVWDQMTDISQANLLEMLGGKRNANVVAALVENFDIAEKALIDSQHAAGSALKENEKYLDSINGKIDQMKASYEDLSSRILSNELVKVIVDIARSVLEFFNKLDASTNGWSTKLITFFTLFVMARGVFLAFADSVNRTGSMLNLFFGIFSKGGRAIALTQMVTTIDRLKTAFIGLYSAVVVAASSGSTFTGVIANVAKAVGYLKFTLISAASLFAIAAGAYSLYEYFHVSLKEAKEDLDEVTQKVNELTSAIETNKARIKELQDLKKAGTISLVEQDELTKLEHENTLLEQRLAIEERIQEAKKKVVSSKAASELGEFVRTEERYDAHTGQVIDKSGYQIAQEDLEKYRSAERQYQREYLKGEEANKKLLKKYDDQRAEALEALSASYEKVSGLMLDIDWSDPKNAGLLSSAQTFLDQIDLAIGGAEALGKVWGNIWSDERSYPGIQKIQEVLSSAASTSTEAFDAAFRTYLDSGKLDPIVERLKALGISLDDGSISTEQLKAMFADMTKEADIATTSIEGLTTTLESFSEKQELITSAQKEFSKTGVISAKTLSSMAEQFPTLKDSIDLYILGLKSGKALLAEMSSAYETDVNNYKKSLVSKAQASPEFYNKLTADQKKLIDELAKSYGIDLENFKTLEQQKLDFQSKIIARLASNYSQYAGASLEGLYGNLEVLRQRIMAETDDKKQRELIKEKMAVQAAIIQTKKFTEALDSITYDSLQYDPDKFTSSTDSKSKGTDKHKEAAEKEIAALKHQYEIEKITAEQYYDGLEDIEKRYYTNSEQNRAKYIEEIRAIDEELFSGRREILKDWLNDQGVLADKAASSGNVKSQTGIYRGMIDRIKKMIDAAHAYGLDASSDYVQELESQIVDLQQNILDAMRGSYEDFISHMDDFDLWKSFDFSKFDVLKRELKEVIALYEQGLLTWQQYVDARNEIAKGLHDTRRDSLETILDLTMEMIKQEGQEQVDALDKQIDAYQKVIDLKKKLLQDTSNEKKHEQEVADLVKSIAELQSKIAQLSLDDSREAAAKRAELEQQLHDKQKELADLQGDYTLDQTLDVLDKSQEAFEDEKEAEKDAIEDSIDSWQELYEKAIARINGDWDGLYKDLMKYEMEHRNSIDGPDSLVTAWKNATSAMQEYNNNFEDAYNGTGRQDWINPDVANSPEAKKILEQMKSNSEIAKQMGTSQVGGKNLHQENQALADRFYELTGRKLYYNNGWRLDNMNGELAYQVGSTNKNPSRPSADKPQNSGGGAYAAATEKYGSPPSGTLKVGSKGDGVKWLQYYLKQLGLFPYAVDGTFYTRTEEALKAFQRMAKLNPDGIYGSKTRKALPNYHTGGIVTNAGSIGNGEVLAVLKTGEWVLDDQRKQNLKEMFAGIKSTISTLTAGNLSNRVDALRPSPAAVSGGDTFAPNISVSISHSGEMRDSDAKRYGQEIADTALERLKNAFTKRGI